MPLGYKKITITVIAVLTAAALGIVFVELDKPNHSLLISQNAGAVPIGAEADYEYLLKEYSGRLAVFHRGGSDPDLVFDVYTQNLPDFDRIQLKNGIAAKDYAQLVDLIEDYTS